MFDWFGSSEKQLPDGYVKLTINPRQIWKPSPNMLAWPTRIRVFNYLEHKKFPVVDELDGPVVINTDFGRFELHIEEKATVGRGSRRVSIVMGPFNATMPPEIHSLRQEIADLFVKGKKVDWHGPANLRGWWE